MNKKITTLVLALFLGSAMFAQNNLLLGNFEDGTLNGFAAGGGGSSVATVANPASDAVNGSAQVLQLTYPPAYQNWDGTTKGDGTSFILSATPGSGRYRYLHFMIYKPFTSKMLFVAQNKDKSAEQMCGEVPNTKANQWEYVIIDLLNGGWAPFVDGDHYNGLSIRVERETPEPFHTNGFVCYLDNIYLSDSSEPITTALKTVNMQQNNAYVSRANGKVTLHLNEATNAIGKIEVLNIQGQVVKNVFKGKINEGQSTFDFSLENQGLYLLKITTDKGVQCIKF